MRPFGASIGLALSVLLAIVPGAQVGGRSTVAERVSKLTRESRWTLVNSVPVGFITHHPQGMVKVGDTLLVSSVEVKVRTRRYAKPIDGYDRDTGEGTGRLFKMDMNGKLIAELTLGEGTMYHPGGIDFDGRYIWVPVAEYRPNRRSIVYRVDPETMKAEEMFRFADHLGGVARNTDDNTLHAVSWGSRRFYRWRLDANRHVVDARVAPENLRRLNPAHYVDYQECKYVGSDRMLCTGVTEFRTPSAGTLLRLGGIDLVSLADGRPLHQVPVLLWTAGGVSMTQNPAWFEPTGTGLRAYFIPEDDKSTLYIYEVATP